MFCVIFRAEEVKSHSFFADMDWQQVYLQKYQPPLVPPRGEVNAADAFDIGSFDEEDTKGIKVLYSAHQKSFAYFPWRESPQQMRIDFSFRVFSGIYFIHVFPTQFEDPKLECIVLYHHQWRRYSLSFFPTLITWEVIQQKSTK